MAKLNKKNQSEKKRALSLFQRNRLQEAEIIYSKLCKNKQDTEAHHMLGLIKAQQGNFFDAEDLFRQAIKNQPNIPVLHYLLGGALFSMNQPNDAVESIKHAIQLKPDFVEAYFQLAQYYNSLGRENEAKEYYQKIVKIKPDMVPALVELGRLHKAQGAIDEAMGCYRQAVKHDKNLIDIHYELGVLLNITGQNDEALHHFKEAQRIKPDHINAIAGEASVYEWNKDYQKAFELISPLLDKGIEHPGIANVYSQLCKYFDLCDEAITYSEKLLLKNNLPQETKRQLHFSLGKLYDKNNTYNKAFKHYKNGNNIKTSQKYDTTEHSSINAAQFSTFNSTMLSETPRSTIDTSKAIFIVGMPRSGTSLVEQILASHPEISAAGELSDIHYFTTALPPLLDAELGYPRCLRKMTPKVADGMAQQYLHHLNNIAPDAKYVTDKMPHNFMHLGLISLLFPDAHIIHCRRDPMDTCLSNYFQNFTAGYAYATDLYNLGHHYREYENLMDHWRQVLDIPILDISYENIVSNIEDETKKMLKFLDLPWNENCLKFYQSKRKVGTASYDQVREPIYNKSVARWKHYEKYLDDLKKGLGIN